VRQYHYPTNNAHQDLHDLAALALQSVSTLEIIQTALELAQMYDLPIYAA
jgi:hypothetical protein